MEELQESWLLTVEADCGLLCFSCLTSAFLSSSSNLIWPTTREEKDLKDSAKYLQLLFLSDVLGFDLVPRYLVKLNLHDFFDYTSANVFIA